MLDRFLDPKNDIAFKKIFDKEKNKDILIHFLNDVILFAGKRPICSVTFLPAVQDTETVSQKVSIVDILCKDDEGCSYIVEMQVAKTKGFEKRAQFYASRAYCTQATRGDKYHDLKEVIFLAIADYVMFPEKKKYKSDHIILDRETYEQDLKDFSFTFIELPKFNETLAELSSFQEKWCYFFRNVEETPPEELDKLLDQEPIFKKAYQELDRAYWTAEELRSYDQAEKRTKDYIASLDQKFDEGKEEGRVEERAKAEQEKSLAIKNIVHNLTSRVCLFLRFA